MTKKEALRQVEQTGRLMDLGILYDDAETLRRCSMTLHRWAELECGDSNPWGSWAIERDETTGKPFMVTYPNEGKTRRRAIPDRETGALRRIKRILEPSGLHYYHQTDPRGAALYIAKEPLTAENYNRGIAVC